MPKKPTRVELEIRVAELELANEKLQADLKKSEDDLNQALSVFSNESMKVDKLTSQIEELEADHDRKDRHLKSLREDYKNLGQQLADKSREVAMSQDLARVSMTVHMLFSEMPMKATVRLFCQVAEDFGYSHESIRDSAIRIFQEASSFATPKLFEIAKLDALQEPNTLTSVHVDKETLEWFCRVHPEKEKKVTETTRV